ncbi:MAG: FkbM family methyltransferase [Roseinatronobacter sp.]
MSFETQATTAMTQLARDAVWFDLDTQSHRRASARVLKRLFFNLARALGSDVFAEAGAMDARYSVRARKVLPKAQIIAFEANPHNHAAFSVTPEMADARVDYRLTALSDHDGPQRFKVLVWENGRERRKVSGRSSLMEREAGRAARYEEVEVPGTTLDTALGPLPGRVALKVDVEGAAEPVLRGAAQTLARTDLVVIEVETRAFWQGQWLHLDVCAHLMAAGLIPVARDFEFPNQFNLVFLSPRALGQAGVLEALERYHSWLAVQAANDWAG